jgi:hypothetical protein
VGNAVFDVACRLGSDAKGFNTLLNDGVAGCCSRGDSFLPEAGWLRSDCTRLSLLLVTRRRVVRNLVRALSLASKNVKHKKTGDEATNLWTYFLLAERPSVVSVPGIISLSKVALTILT